MHTVLRSLAVTLAALVVVGEASAGPIATTVTLNIAFGKTLFSVTNPGTVDMTGNTLTIPAGLVVAPAGLTIPVTSGTGITALSVP